MTGKDPLKSPPPAGQIGQAIELYMRHAYGPDRPQRALKLLPPEGDFDPAAYLAGEKVERPANPPEPGHGEWFAIRLGNSMYPHMKLKVVYLPAKEAWLFNVDSHDTFVEAPRGSPDSAELVRLKEFNASVAEAVEADWDRAGLLTQKGLLRRTIQAKRQRR